MRIAVSRCLLGERCRYDGASKPHGLVGELCAADGVDVLGVCPECAGGLAIPRPPAERAGDRVRMADGTDVTAEFERGARISCDAALEFGAELAILKERSPSCGAHLVYDGTHSGTLVEGEGMLAARLRAAGVAVASEVDVEEAAGRLPGGDAHAILAFCVERAADA